jgi:hypothetical protein
MTSPSRRALFDAPAMYEISVYGRLDGSWSPAAAEMSASTYQEQGECATTTLTGRLSDQACLLGVLTELYDMGYALLEARRLSEPSAEGGSAMKA